MTHGRNAAMSISQGEGGERRRRLWRIAILAAGLAALASAALSLGQSGPRLLAQAAVPTQIAGLSAEAWSGKVTLTWTKPAAGEAVTDYQICWSASAISTTCGTGGTRGADGQWSLDIDASTGVTAGETSVSYDWFTPDGISTTAATNFAVRAKNTFGTFYGPISASTSATAIAETTPAFLMPAVGPQTFLEGAAIDIAMPRVRGGDAPISYSLAVTGPSPAVTAVTPSTIGLSFDSATGRITSTADGAGGATGVTADATYSATVTVTDGDGDTDTEAFDVTIENNTMPAFGGTTITAQSFTESAAITPLNVPTASGGVTGGNAPLTYSVSANLPTGLSIDPSTGIISGTPAAVIDTTSPVTVTVTVTDNDGQSNSTSFTIVIANAAAVAGGALEIEHPGNIYIRETSTGNPISYTNQSPAVTFAATGVIGTATYSLSAADTTKLSSFQGACCTLSGNKIVGTPGAVTADQTQTITITVTDSGRMAPNNTDSATFDITMMDVTGASALAFASGAPSPQTYDFAVGEDVSFNYPVTGGYPPYTYSATGLPSWLSLDAGTGHLSGTAAAGQGTGPWTHGGVSVTVTDRDGNSFGPLSITLEIFPDTTLSWDTSTVALPTNKTFTKGAAITAINLPPVVTTRPPPDYVRNHHHLGGEQLRGRNDAAPRTGGAAAPPPRPESAQRREPP